MPRTVIYDLKGGFGSMRKINALYEAENTGEPTALWFVALVFLSAHPSSLPLTRVVT